MENRPGTWNFGESAQAADAGGLRDWPNPNPQLGVHVHQYVVYGTNTPEGWVAHTTGGVQVWRLRGYLRPQALPITPTPYPSGNDPLADSEPTRVRDAAFEIIATNTFDPSKRTVIVLQTPPTFGGDVTASTGIKPDIGLPFAYGGFNAHSGLERNQGSGPQQSAPDKWTGHVPLMWANGAGGTQQFNLWCVRVMPQLVGRPARFQMQRNLEVVRAVQQMLVHPLTNGFTPWRPNTSTWQNFVPASPNLAPFPCVIEGGSLGGAVSQWSAVLFPSDFHGAVSAGACPSIRAWVGEQEAHRQLGTLSGFSEQSSNFGPSEALQYSAALAGVARDYYGTGTFTPAQLADWSSFYHTALPGAWRDGFLKRPVYLIVADEDYIASGIDTIPLFTGLRSFVSSGQAIGLPGPARPPVYFSLVAKSSHFADLRPFSPSAPPPVRNIYLPASLSQSQLSFEEAILAFLPAAIASRDSAPTMAFLPPTRQKADATQDPWDHVLQPSAPLPPQPPAGTGTPLRLDPNFLGQTPAAGSHNVLPLRNMPVGGRRLGKHFGAGTHLSPGDSIVAIEAVQGNPPSFCVGSAEGVVTRFALEPRNSNPPSSLAGELVPQAMSISLGYGAWSMCRAQANGSPAKEIIVGTRRGLHALHFENLEVVLSKRDLDWELANPRFLQAVDAIPGGYDEVIFASENGTVAVYECDPAGGDFLEIGRFSEPGVLDMHVVRQGEGEGQGVLTIFILSARGHVIKLEWNPMLNGVPPTVVATSPRMNGTGVDMEWTGAPGKELAVLRIDVDSAHDEEIWYLNAVDLSAVGGDHRQLGVTDLPLTLGTQAAHRGLATNLAVRTPLGGSPELILMRNGQLSVFGIGSTTGPVAVKDLVSFPPYARPIGMAVVEVDGLSAGPEIVITTEAGYVGWVSYIELSSPATSFSMYGTQPTTQTRPSSINGMHGNVNRTLSATWGMTVDHSGATESTLEVVDQSGSRWSVKANGDVSFRCELGGVYTVPPVNAWAARPGAYRSLHRIPHALGPAPAGGNFTIESLQLGPSTLLPFASPASVQTIKTWPYYPKPGTIPPFLNIAGGEWESSPTFQPNRIYIQDGFIAFPMAGDVLLDDLSQAHFAWWSGDPWLRTWDWPNRVQGLGLHLQTQSTPTVLGAQYWWSTSGGTNSTSPPPIPATLALPGHDLRNHGNVPHAITDAQALRLFRDPASGEPRIALNTPGGRLMVLEPGTAATNWQGAAPKEHSGTTVLDFGTGGMALATAQRGSGDVVDLYLAPLIDYSASAAFFGSNPGVADDLTSCLVYVPYQGAATFAAASLQPPTILRLDGQGGRPKVYGVCGMEVGDILSAYPGPELIVGSLDGHLLVYDLLANGQIGTLLYQTQVEGAVGAYNSIVVADLDRDGTNELYVAGSLGLWKWIP